MTTADEGATGEPFDPAIAERFRLLERLNPPELDLATLEARPTAVTTLYPGRSIRSRVLAVAAVLVVVGAASAAVLFAASDSSTGVETAEPAGSESGASIRSSGESTESTTTAIAVSSGDPAESGSDGDPAAGGAAVTTGSTEAPGQTTPTTATTTPETTQPAANESTATPLTSVSLIPEDEGIVTIAGTVTAVFSDCESHLVLQGNGEVRSVGPISCDGGSWIEIDGTRIRTSSGYTSGDQAYDRHWRGLQPGVAASVTAISPGGRGQLTLDCPVCGIAVGDDDRRAGNPGNGNGLGNGNGSGLGNGNGNGLGNGNGKGNSGDLEQPGGPGGGADT